MSAPAFYLPPHAWAGDLVLTGEELAHCKALRLKEGEEVLLLDGEGVMALCRIASLTKKAARLDLMAQKKIDPPQSRAIMALALSKAVRRDFFMEKAAELGAWEIWLWQAERSQGKLEESVARSAIARLISGMKQCRGAWLPKFRMLSGAFSLARASGDASWRMLAWEAQGDVALITPVALGRPGNTVYAIGPEGGFAPWEVECLRNADFLPMSLGNRVLRCETAATFCLGLHMWASQLPGHPDFNGGDNP